MPRLKKDLSDSRYGKMFENEFCFAPKTSGKEPGFRTIELTPTFFEILTQKLATLNSDEIDALLKELQDDLANVDSKLENPKLNATDRLGLEEKQRYLQWQASEVKGAALEDLKFVGEALSNKGNDLQLTLSQNLKNPAFAALCCSIFKKAIDDDKNADLNAWLYKLDYVQGTVDRISNNKEAIREYLATRLARSFSQDNQEQRLQWLDGNNALLACGWKVGLETLTTYLRNNTNGEWRGILAKENKAWDLDGLAKNAIFCIAIGDRDTIGKEGQNKGVAEDKFYGFDYGKAYEDKGICDSLEDNFTFTDTFANTPSFLRADKNHRFFGKAINIGIARHKMYRNFNIFNVCSLADRMHGAHILNYMITGVKPSNAILNSYPSLENDIFSVQNNTTSLKELKTRIDALNIDDQLDDKQALKVYKELKSKFQESFQEAKNLSPFALTFQSIKLEIFEQAIKSDMPMDEFKGYWNFIQDMQKRAIYSNQKILSVFEHRLALNKSEIELLEHLELYCNKNTTAHYSDNKETIALNRLVLTPEAKRIPFQLHRADNSIYLITPCREKAVLELFQGILNNYELKQTGENLCIELNEDQLITVKEAMSNYYQRKYDTLLGQTPRTHRSQSEPVASLYEQTIENDSMASKSAPIIQTIEAGYLGDNEDNKPRAFHG